MGRHELERLHCSQKDLRAKDKDKTWFSSSNEKYKTTSSDPGKPSTTWESSSKKNKNLTISTVQKEQYDYIKNNLYIKSAVDREKTILKFQLKKLSIRNYTPKTINQEINMGMWI